MKTCDPYRNIVKEAVKSARRLASKRQFQAGSREKARAYLNSTHRFELIENGIKTGDTRIGNGNEIKLLNEEFLKRYQTEVGAEIDAGVPYGQTKSTLKRWICVEKFVEVYGI